MSSNFTKNALVTGAATRLGREIAIALAKDGWNVAVHYHSTQPDETLAAIKNTGQKAIALKADLLNFKEIENLLPEAQKQLGEITLLVNNASIFEKIRFGDSTEKDYDDHMDIHVKAPFFLSQAFVGQIKNRGQIINVVDSFTSKNKSSYFAYLVSKKALRSLSKMLSVELAPKILVNAIFPGTVEEFSDNLSPEFYKKKLGYLPMQRFTKAKEVKDVILMLANSELTGQEIFIDSGEQLI